MIGALRGLPGTKNAPYPEFLSHLAPEFSLNHSAGPHGSLVSPRGSAQASARIAGRRPSRALNLFLSFLLLAFTALGATGCKNTLLLPEDDVAVETSSPSSLGVGVSDALLRRGFEYGTPPEGQIQKVYYVPGGRGSTYEQMLKDFLLSDELKVKHFPSFLNNETPNRGGLDLLFVQDTTEHIAIIEDFLTKLETRIPQVEIEAKIAEVFISDSLEVGATSTFTEQDFNELTLFDTARSRFNTNGFIDSLSAGGASGFQGGVINFGTVQDEILINLIFEALARKENTRIIAEPTLRVLSGFTGKVITGERTPVQTARIVNNAVTVDTQFEQTGVQLTVTPTVIGEDDIQLFVNPEVSVVTGFTDPGSTAGISSPIISNRNAETIVMVKNGHSLVLGGLNSKQIVEVESRIPILGSIPFIKHLFRSVREETVTTRLYFVITPRITNDQGQYEGNILYPPEEDDYED